MDEKRVKILEAAMEEFTEKGYQAASTNKICAKAEVSKGLIFHYFGSKEKLYIAAVSYAIDFAANEVSLEREPWADFVEMAIWSTKMKLDFNRKYPAVFGLIMQAYGNPPTELKGKLDGFFDKAIEQSKAQMNQVLSEMKLKKDVNMDATHKVMAALFQYITEKSTIYLQHHPDATMDDFIPLANEFTEMMRIVEFGICDEKKDLGE
ncbi:TetR/AcrR family transcriptional regulator [Listeria welshimeri]|uniref:macrodiolide transporter TimAB transcriptional regulator TimA n=1 Tax=Listeria welshimeri TaxID=1643 RepID=UPI00162818D8|nr:macrodiolide transporter TimAB transcriptional regulator TimA [Listeria welshimeri]MBC1341290.1 TetR/AcrR family transcriptional regulator [Listeria welshimeri]MBC1346461.1 TetR/AcrR family transcriptional regulator [Listeria welshimeri]MBC1600489.1 TetR/AcrR family transcriptional regulator [Listeria welshimeri]MBC1707595.1 TetR/AcrR family transcriptional regulator [Listeria welshimeri]MBC1952974.1 TetR/AcrR family transcriptional regulator [Listeria welshimeri]